MGWMMEQPNKLRISGSLLAHNTLLNLIGQAVLLSVGVVTLPFLCEGWERSIWGCRHCAEQKHDLRPGPEVVCGQVRKGSVTSREW